MQRNINIIEDLEGNKIVVIHDVKHYNVFHASLLIRHDKNGKLYLYDIIDIKKETSTPLES